MPVPASWCAAASRHRRPHDARRAAGLRHGARPTPPTSTAGVTPTAPTSRCCWCAACNAIRHLAARLRKLGEALYVEARLPARMRTIAILRICALVRCEYEWGGQAAFWGPIAGVSDDECDALVTGGADDPRWAEAERVADRRRRRTGAHRLVVGADVACARRGLSTTSSGWSCSSPSAGTARSARCATGSRCPSRAGCGAGRRQPTDRRSRRSPGCWLREHLSSTGRGSSLHETGTHPVAQTRRSPCRDHVRARRRRSGPHRATASTGTSGTPRRTSSRPCPPLAGTRCEPGRERVATVTPVPASSPRTPSV